VPIAAGRPRFSLVFRPCFFIVVSVPVTSTLVEQTEQANLDASRHIATRKDESFFRTNIGMHSVFHLTSKDSNNYFLFRIA
jgi:hypothetical protein